MSKAKKFIDKKKSVTFQLVHRSQQDPLIADEDAPQRVLLPVGENKEVSRDEIIDEQQKYGIYYTDDSDYLSNLKDPSDHRVEWPAQVEKSLKEKKVKIQLPSEVFASRKEDDEGMLSRAAPISGPQLHLDPDVVAAMDEDFNFSDPENELEDNFIELAEGVASDQEFDEQYERESDFGSDFESERSFGDEETKSRFTNYSMTSSVMKRNDQLTLLDERFEKMYEDYDENEIGALDCEEIEGHVPESSDILLKYADEFEKDQKRELLDKEILATKIKEQLENDDEDDGNDDFEYLKLKEGEKWDCESILSTYSNIYNHPKIIKEPRKSDNKIEISTKTGIPMNVLGANKLTQKALDRLNEENQFFDQSQGPKSTGVRSVISQLSELSVRPKNETSLERRERKNNLKEFKRERRVEKKMNSLAFKEEAKRQAIISINNRNNIQGNQIL